MPVEHQALAAAAAAQTADRVDTVGLDRRDLDFQTKATHLFGHPGGQGPLAFGLAIALVLHHAAQEIEAVGGIETAEDVLGLHSFSPDQPTGAGEAAINSRV